jgi:hypothetical protein
MFSKNTILIYKINNSYTEKIEKYSLAFIAGLPHIVSLKLCP